MSVKQRQIDAMCHSCCGGERIDCGCVACPLYPSSPYATMDPLCWWDLPKHMWDIAETTARCERRVMDRPDRSEAQIAADAAAADRLEKIRRGDTK